MNIRIDVLNIKKYFSEINFNNKILLNDESLQIFDIKNINKINKIKKIINFLYLLKFNNKKNNTINDKNSADLSPERKMVRRLKDRVNKNKYILLLLRFNKNRKI